MKKERGESRQTGSVNIRLMVCSLKSQRSARPSGPKPGRCNGERFFQSGKRRLSSHGTAPLLTNHTCFNILLIYMVSADLSYDDSAPGLKAARSKSIDWFPEEILVSTPTGTRSVLPPLLWLVRRQVTSDVPRTPTSPSLCFTIISYDAFAVG